MQGSELPQARSFAVGQAAAGLRPLSLAALMLALSAATILAALGFEHIGGYLPCHLCLMERTPYYLGVPLAALTILALRLAAAGRMPAVLFALFAALMLYSAGLAVYHAGVEWAFWEGPASCSPSVGIGSAADMLNQLQNAHAPSCTDATWRLLGLSFAGWNAVISLVLCALGAAGLRASLARLRGYGSSSASQ